MPPEIIAAIDIQLEDNTPAPLAPIFLPHNPEINVLNKGIKKKNIYIFLNINLLWHHELFVI